MSILSKCKRKIVNKIKYELGITRLQEENESFYFLLNNCLDITKMPPTKDPDLRILQKCDAQLLAIFDKLCQKYNLSYWLHWGTLIGAVRHKGFIPWDDDVDVAMPREDYDKVLHLMKQDIEKLGFKITYSNIHPLRGLVLSCGENTGVWIDIFPLDTCVTNDDVKQIYSAMKTYRHFFWENSHLSRENLMKKKEEILANCPKGVIKYFLPAMEVWRGAPEYAAYPETDIFPIKQMNFEGFDLNVPSKPHEYLCKSFKFNYMEFPRCAMNNHGQADSLPMSQRAKANGIDMNEVYQHLLDIYEKIDKETK